MSELDWLRSLVVEEGPSVHQVVRMGRRLLRHIRSVARQHRLRRAAITAEAIRNCAKVVATIPYEGVNAHE